jgi:hypothetical protein
VRKDSCHSLAFCEKTKQDNKDLVSDEEYGIPWHPANAGKNEKWQKATTTQANAPNWQHDVSVESIKDFTTRSGLPKSSTRPSPVPSILFGSSYNTPHERTTPSRPISERYERPRSFSSRIRGLLFRSDHQRSKSTSFILGSDPVDYTS